MTALAWFGFSSLAFAIIWIGVFAAVDWAIKRRQWQQPPVDLCCCRMVDMHDPHIEAWHVGGARHSRDDCDFDQ